MENKEIEVMNSKIKAIENNINTHKSWNYSSVFVLILWVSTIIWLMGIGSSNYVMTITGMIIWIIDTTIIISHYVARHS